MCKYNDEIGKVIKKYEVYNCDLGNHNFSDEYNLGKVRPCIIVSSEAINSPHSCEYLIVPLRTEHEYPANTWKDAENVVKKRRECGRLYVPVKFPNQFSFADVTQLRRVPSVKIAQYKGTLLDSARNRIDNGLSKYIFNTENVYDDTYPNDTDIFIGINKFDIWRTEDSQIVVILQDRQPGQNSFLVAPVYENENAINDCHIKVPLAVRNTAWYINITKTTRLADVRFTNRLFSIIDDNAKINIAKGMVQLLCGDIKVPMHQESVLEEKPVPAIETVAPVVEIQEKKEENKVVEFPKRKKTPRSGRKPIPFPQGFSLYYKKIKAGQLSRVQLAKKIGVSETTVRNMIKRYESMKNVQQA